MLEGFAQEFGLDALEDTTQGVGKLLRNLSESGRDKRGYSLEYRATYPTDYLLLDASQPTEADEILAKISNALCIGLLDEQSLTVQGIRLLAFNLQSEMLTDPETSSIISEVSNPSEPKKGVRAREIARRVTEPTLIMSDGRQGNPPPTPRLLALPIAECPGAVLHIGGWGTFASSDLDYQTSSPERPMLIELSLVAPISPDQHD